MMLSSLRGLNMLTGGGEGFDPDLEVIESLVKLNNFKTYFQFNV